MSETGKLLIAERLWAIEAEARQVESLMRRYPDVAFAAAANDLLAIISGLHQVAASLEKRS